MLYLDSNVFVYAALNRDEVGKRARSLLGAVQLGRLPAASSALAFDEIVWAVKKHRSPEDAATAGEAFLKMPGLELLSVDGDLLPSALKLIRRYQLDPRDAIHAASALRARAEAIVSSDPHFDRLEEIGRRSI